MTEPHPYELGWLAYEMDLPVTENPYPKDDMHYYSWRSGWYDAQDEE